MRDKPLCFHPEAVEDAVGAHAWYAGRSARAADLFLRELESALENISHAPQRWPAYLSQTRRMPLHRFPFFIVYRESADFVEILAVAHGRRRPGYWRDRAE